MPWRSTLFTNGAVSVKRKTKLKVEGNQALFNMQSAISRNMIKYKSASREDTRLQTLKAVDDA